jgi:nucleotide-binding universal stress UspA family protein
MIERVLLAVDDTPGSLAATRVAVAVARDLHARLRAVHVSTDHLFESALAAATGHPEVRTGRDISAAAVLGRVTTLATAAGVDAETDLLAGDIARAVLDTAHSWAADLVIVGKSARSVSGEPYVGTQTRHILEFAEQPVLVVPPAQRR